MLTAAHVLAGEQEADGKTAGVRVLMSRRPNLTMQSDKPERVPGITLNARTVSVTTPESRNGRADLGVAELPRDKAEEHCAEFGLEPINLKELKEGDRRSPEEGLHIMVGCPQDRQGTRGRGGVYVESAWLNVCRMYKAGDLKYIGYGVNRQDATGEDFNRSWKGFSGSPIWRSRLKPGRAKALARINPEVSFDDFGKPELIGLACYQQTDYTGTGLDAPKGFMNEIYGHYLSTTVIEYVEAMLDMEVNT